MKTKSLKQKILSSERVTKTILVLVNDFLLFILSSLVALSISFENVYLPSDLSTFTKLISGPILWIFLLYIFGIYRSLVRFLNFTAIIELVSFLFFFFLLDLIFFIFTTNLNIYQNDVSSIKDLILGWLLALFFIVGSRILASTYFSEDIAESKVVIYGAGSAGIQLAGALKHSSEMKPIAFVDKNASLQNTLLGGIKVLSPDDFHKMISRKKVDEVLIAMPSVSSYILNCKAG